jgi:hypothetical protein
VDGFQGPVDDPRGAIALARLNWIHGKYSIVCFQILMVINALIPEQKNDDMKYNLALFMFEPVVSSLQICIMASRKITCA